VRTTRKAHTLPMGSRRSYQFIVEKQHTHKSCEVARGSKTAKREDRWLAEFGEVVTLIVRSPIFVLVLKPERNAALIL